MSYSEIIIGFVIGVVVAFGTGFLKKAGEDLYSIIKGRFFPKKEVSEKPETHKISIELLNSNQGTASHQNHIIVKPDLDEGSPIPIERVSAITVEKIQSEIEAAPPMQRQAVADRYLGFNIEWDCFFQNGTALENDMVRVRLKPNKEAILSSVRCVVSLSKYKELGIIHAGTKVRISGKIGFVDDWEIIIEDAHLRFFQ